MAQKRTNQKVASAKAAARRREQQRIHLQKARLQQQETQQEKANWSRLSIPMWGRMLVAVAVVLLLMLVFFRVDQFEVSGNVRYTTEEVADASGVTQGDVLMGVSKTRAASRILTKLPYVRRVVVTKLLPGTIRFEVVEDTAAAVVSSEFGTAWLINDGGKLLEQADEAAETAYPVITGTVLMLPTAGDEAEYDDGAKGQMAMKILASLETLGLTGYVQEIGVEDLENVTVTYQERLEVQLGDGSDLDYKLQYMTQAASQLAATDRGILDLSFATGSQAVFHPVR